jgi:hypothetical protein
VPAELDFTARRVAGALEEIKDEDAIGGSHQSSKIDSGFIIADSSLSV